MVCRKILPFLSLSLLFLLVLGQTSCDKFSGSQTIPAYLKIDSIRLTTDYSIQGTASNKITDAWVYVDGDFIGTFQLPATFPVLKQGTHTLMVLAGVMQDGIATTRISYPFYTEITKTVNLVPQKTLDVGILTTTYSSKTKFVWKEDFDQAAITLDTTSEATMHIGLTTGRGDSTFEGNHSAIIELDTIGSTFAAASRSAYHISSTSAMFLELNYNITSSLTVGVYVTVLGIVTQVPIMTLNPSNGSWKKIYINLTNILNAYSGATVFKVYYYFENTTGDHYRILMDNIKVLSF